MEKLDYLRSAWESCTRCRLHETRKHVVFGSGSATAPLVIIGEAPGADEDESGVPFVGQAGELLTWAIRRAGIVRREVFITNTLACRPPGNRDPLPSEQEACWPRLVNIIDIVAPQCLLLIGKPAARLVLGREVYITRERGTTGTTVVGDRSIDYVLALHPSYIMRQPLLDGGRRMRQELVEDIMTAWDVADQIPF